MPDIFAVAAPTKSACEGLSKLLVEIGLPDGIHMSSIVSVLPAQGDPCALLEQNPAAIVLSGPSAYAWFFPGTDAAFDYFCGRSFSIENTDCVVFPCPGLEQATAVDTSAISKIKLALIRAKVRVYGCGNPLVGPLEAVSFRQDGGGAKRYMPAEFLALIEDLLI